jgi:glycosyltransferase involved in cell wall biosynthesis
LDGLISVIVTTYNWEPALDAALGALARQTDRNFEVVIADDGSRAATTALIEEWKARAPYTLTHVWQEDRGFRAAEARNRAIISARGTYCIFLDGDCIARPDFVASHRRLAEPGRFVAGNRTLLSQTMTETILRDRIDAGAWSFGDLVTLRRRGAINRLAPMIRLPLGPLRGRLARRWEGVRSANLAIWRADLDRVDGFDAAFDGWGREDSDIVVRLIRAGVLRKDGRFATGVLHLWHREADRSRLPDNDRLFDTVLNGDRIRAQRGLSMVCAQGDD